MPRRQPPTRTSRTYESVQQGADRVGVTPRTIRRWIAAGRLTGYRMGPRLIRIDADELDALMTPIASARTGGAA